MHCKINHRFGKLWGEMILVVLLLSGLAVLTGCALTEPGTTGSPDFKQGTGPDQQSSAGQGDEKNYLTSLQMIDTETGWACTPQAVLRTVDGGESWTDVTPGEQAGQGELTESSLLGLDEQNAVLTLNGRFTHQIILCRTTDGGETWKQSSIDTGSNSAYSSEITFIDQEHGWLLARYDAAMGSEADDVFQTTDGGATWKPLATSVPKEGKNDDTAKSFPFVGIKNGFVFSDPANGWLSGFTHGDGIFFYQTADGGASWNLKTLTVPAGYSTAGGSANSDRAVFFSGQAGVLPVEFRGQTPPALVFYLTTDGGKNWQAMPPLPSSRESFRGFQTAVVDAGHAYVSDGYELFYSADGMRTFIPVATGLDLLNLSQLDFISPSTGWAIIDGNLWKTKDGGHTWKQTAARFASKTAAGAGMNLNGAVFKNRGDLAFTWRGILYILYGDSGEVKQLSDSGQAFYPTWSADGQWLAFLTAGDGLMPQGHGEQGTAAAGSGNIENGRLCLVSRDGRESRVLQGLQELPIVPASISWSPVNSILAVQGQGEIWLVPAKGEPYQVPPGTEKFSGLSSWSPDGKSLACRSETELSQEERISKGCRMIFYAYNLDTGSLTTTGQLEMPVGTGALFAAWRPDGQGMLYWPDPAYSASLAADGLELHSLRWGESQSQVLPCGLGYRPWLSFFPDGRLLMVAGGGRFNWAEKNLTVCELETGNTKILPNPAGSVAVDPALSPDGKQIAFVAAQNLGRETGGFSEPGQLADWVATRTLWLENSDGSGAHPLKAAGGGIYQPSWSNDGTAILYVRDNSLWLVEAGGGNPQKVIGPFPDWSEDLFGYYGYVWHDNFAWFSK